METTTTLTGPEFVTTLAQHGIDPEQIKAPALVTLAAHDDHDLMYQPAGSDIILVVEEYVTTDPLPGFTSRRRTRETTTHRFPVRSLVLGPPTTQ